MKWLFLSIKTFFKKLFLKALIFTVLNPNFVFAVLAITCVTCNLVYNVTYNILDLFGQRDFVNIVFFGSSKAGFVSSIDFLHDRRPFIFKACMPLELDLPRTPESIEAFEEKLVKTKFTMVNYETDGRVNRIYGVRRANDSLFLSRNVRVLDDYLSPYANQRDKFVGLKVILMEGVTDPKHYSNLGRRYAGSTFVKPLEGIHSISGGQFTFCRFEDFTWRNSNFGGYYKNTSILEFEKYRSVEDFRNVEVPYELEIETTFLAENFSSVQRFIIMEDFLEFEECRSVENFRKVKVPYEVEIETTFFAENFGIVENFNSVERFIIMEDFSRGRGFVPDHPSNFRSRFHYTDLDLAHVINYDKKVIGVKTIGSSG